MTVIPMGTIAVALGKVDSSRAFGWQDLGGAQARWWGPLYAIRPEFHWQLDDYTDSEDWGSLIHIRACVDQTTPIEVEVTGNIVERYM